MEFDRRTACPIFRQELACIPNKAAALALGITLFQHPYFRSLGLIAVGCADAPFRVRQPEYEPQ
jgi:hypothetical protein